MELFTKSIKLIQPKGLRYSTFATRHCNVKNIVNPSKQNCQHLQQQHKPPLNSNVSGIFSSTILNSSRSQHNCQRQNFWNFSSSSVDFQCRKNFVLTKLNSKDSTNIQRDYFVAAAARSKSRVCYKMAPIFVPTVKLNNGYEMPVLGLGTYESKNNDAELAVKHGIDVGYRHIDTAYFYQNEAEIGKAIRDKIAEGVIKREDIFLVTKLWNIHHDPQLVEGACRKQLKSLGLDYIDLYLMHLPVGYKYVNDETLMPKDEAGTLQLTDIDYLDTYKAMEQLVKLGLVRSIGVSNFNSEQILRVLENCEIKPVTNQVECSPALNQKKLTKFCKDHGMTLTAYSPLGRPKPAENKPSFYFSEQTKAVAAKYNKTPAQVILRYLVEIGTIPIPKSSNAQRIEENFNIFDFKLSPEDIELMDSFNTGERLVPFNLIKGQNHKYWPFNIEF